MRPWTGIALLIVGAAALVWLAHRSTKGYPVEAR